MKIDKNTKDIIVYAGTGLALYFILLRPLLQKLGIQKTSEELQQQKTQKQGRVKFIEDALKKPKKEQTAGGKPTRPVGQYAIWADQIYEYLKRSAVSDNKVAAFNILMQFIQNDADIALLSKYFGTRSEFAFGLPTGKKNLSEFIVTNLDKDTIARLNSAYARSKMTFRF
jgi:hypothetical protein